MSWHPSESFFAISDTMLYVVHKLAKSVDSNYLIAIDPTKCLNMVMFI